ncbi:helix-turn-helix domain-containing protein [Micromonospora sagamiensis]|uniref:AraC-like DNA-binding protein n=1 Tax=Micromonospora sagamiensis TaxID=47875 RepID=A0A562WEU6_9ACTN|nr:helix-turn-helix domain-containing protein [Micromonospora sagamiensis]TWJ28655.1 AraC-like DNA-binding protein [Micromonospora sagamiensis]BCL12440.1 AraC family transcriptional regulator [Micromonospora sagamiensis]
MDAVSTDDVPPAERFAYWREVISKLAVPYDLHCDPRVENEFWAHAGFSSFGPVRAALATVMPHSLHRTPRRIRQADPEVFEVVCTVRGGGTVTQDGRSADVGGGDLVLLDPSRPYRIEPAPHIRLSRVLLLHTPRSLLPIPPADMRGLTAVRIPGDQGVGALTSQFLLHLAQRMPELGPSDVRRLSTLTVEVLGTALAHALECESVVPPRTRQRALMAQIKSFIRHHLGDARLTPDAIASAHHISLRYLHKLFQQDGQTVAGYVRELRLERCRRDLTDPRLDGRPIQAIAARWGFSSPAHFSQAFRSAYGLSPRQFRRQTTRVHAD